MDLRSTHMDENRFAPERVGSSGVDGEGRGYSGFVEAVSEFGLGCVFGPICVAPPTSGLLVARDGV
jgi:hypothetical protein